MLCTVMRKYSFSNARDVYLYLILCVAAAAAARSTICKPCEHGKVGFRHLLHIEERECEQALPNQLYTNLSVSEL